MAVRVVQGPVAAFRPARPSQGREGVPVGVGPVPATRLGVTLPRPTAATFPASSLAGRLLPFVQAILAVRPGQTRLGVLPATSTVRLVLRAVQAVTTVGLAALSETGVAPVLDKVLVPSRTFREVVVGVRVRGVTSPVAVGPPPTVVRRVRQTLLRLLLLRQVLLGVPETGG